MFSHGSFQQPLEGKIVSLGLKTAVRTSEALDNFNVQGVDRNDPRIVAVQLLQVSFAAVYRGKHSPRLAQEPDRIIGIEL
jgi:hypothetical protein